MSDLAWCTTRPVVAGRRAAIATAHPLATNAGMEMLRAGGNAIDAVVAAAAALGVVEPYMSGPGGVGWLLLHRSDGEAWTLNFSGNAPARATPDQFTPATQTVGPRSCLIPGNVAGWFEALSKCGTLPPDRVFAPAIELAEAGFPLHPFNARMLETNAETLDDEGKRIYSQVPRKIGANLRQPELACSLRRLVQEGPDDFYRGQLGRTIADCLERSGGLISRDDLAAYRPQWEAPIVVDYRGLFVKTCAPNNEGFQILQTLKLLEEIDLAALGHNSADYIQILTEAVKLATADRIRWSGDPKFAPVPWERLLEPNYIRERRRLLNWKSASQSEGERWNANAAAPMVSAGNPGGLTTHLAAVDAAGNIASITQSLGHGFGSGVVVPGTGILLNNFAHWFEIDPSCPTPNVIAPGKRWSSCMAPLHVCRDGRFWFSISTPGSWGILHTSLQMALNIIEFGADPQAAIEAPRFRVWEETRLQIEDRVPESVRAELTRRGHRLELLGDYSYFVGGGQSVMIDPESGARLAGADPRRDGYALAY